DPGAGGQVLDRARDEHLAGGSQRSDARTDVDGDAADSNAQDLDLAGVDARADVQLQALELGHDRERAANGAAGAVEGREEAVARVIHFLAAEAVELSADDLVVLAEEGSPAQVSE